MGYSEEFKEKIISKIGKGTPVHHRSDIYHVKLKKGLSVKKAFEIMKTDRVVEFAEPNWYAHWAHH